MAIEGIVIAAVVIGAALLIFKAHDILIFFNLTKKYLLPILFLSILTALAFSIYHVFVNYNLNITSYAGLTNASKVYFIWLKGLFSNLSGITGYIINQDWLLKARNLTR